MPHQLRQHHAHSDADRRPYDKEDQLFDHGECQDTGRTHPPADQGGRLAYLPAGDDGRSQHQEVEEKAKRRQVESQKQNGKRVAPLDKRLQRIQWWGVDAGVRQILIDDDNAALEPFDVFDRFVRPHFALIQNDVPIDEPCLAGHYRFHEVDIVLTTDKELVLKRSVGVLEPEV